MANIRPDDNIVLRLGGMQKTAIFSAFWQVDDKNRAFS